MLLRELLRVTQGQEMFIRGKHHTITGGVPLFHLNLTSGKVPDELLDRKVAFVMPVPVDRYDRPSAAFQVLLEHE